MQVADWLRVGRARLWAFSRTRRGHVVLLYLVTLLWAGLWAWFDIMVVRKAFPPPVSPGGSTLYYWIATWDFIFPLATLFAFREHAWFPIAAVLGGAWEDLLFYWIQGLPVPAATAPLFYVRAAVFLPLALLAELGIHRVAPRRWPWLAVPVLIVVAALVDAILVGLLVAAFVVYLVVATVADLLRAPEGGGAPWFRGAR